MIVPRLFVVVGAALALSSVVVPSVRADQSVVAPTVRYVFKQQVPLTLDSTRIAVRVAEGASAADAIKAVGLDPATLSPTVLKRWSMVSVPLAAAGAATGVDGYVAALAAQPGVELTSPVFFTAAGDPMWIAGDLLAGFDPTLQPAQHDAIVSAGVGAAKVLAATHDWIPRADRFTLDTRNGFEILAAANALSVRNDVVFAEPDWALTGRESVIPNDVFFPTQWGLHNTGQSGGTADMDIDAPEAWEITQGNSAIFIAVLDTGVELTHPDLNLNVALSVDMSGGNTGGNPGNACDNHGTAVAGCITARTNNTLGVAGVASGCKVVSIRQGASNVPCNGTFTASSAVLASSIDYARTSGCRVTVASIGYPLQAVTETAYQNAVAAGVVNFGATGNASIATIDYPASSASVLAVGAIDRNGNLASFSNTGTGIDFVAPGLDISTTDRVGAPGFAAEDYANISGTSFACPIAAGVAALMLSINQNLTPAEIATIMQNTSVDRGAAGYDTSYGWGIVNAKAALDALPPLNDRCTNAIEVSAGGLFMGTLVNATNDGAASCGSSATNPDVWYKYTNGGCPQLVTVSTCGTNDGPGTDQGIDTVMTLFASCGGAELACNDDAGGTICGEAGLLRDSQITRALAPGESMLIRVSKYLNSPVGPFRLNVSSSIANDNCSGAQTIAAGTPTFFCNAAANTDGPDEVPCLVVNFSGINHDLWYRYQAHGAGRFTVRTCGSTFDTKVAIYPNTCPGASGTVLACNDDSNICGLGSVQSNTSLMGAAGASYLIRVGGYITATGSGTLVVYCSADVNFSGTITVQDIFDFLSAWFAANPTADFNGSGGIGVQDIFDFLSAWFGGC